MKYIVIKNLEDIKKATKIITNKRYTDYEIGIRFKVNGKIKMVFSAINRFGERVVYDPSERMIICNVVVHRVYSDYNNVTSGSPIDHYDIVGPAEFVRNHGVKTNIENSSLNGVLNSIYEKIFNKIQDTTFYEKWTKTHDSETGFSTISQKNKKYKIKSKSINKRKRD